MYPFVQEIFLSSDDLVIAATINPPAKMIFYDGGFNQPLGSRQQT